MSLIRNGGFERGNTDFWTVESTGVLEIDSTNQKYGGYCGKFTAGTTESQYIINNDYIDVNPFDMVNLFAWIKSATTNNVNPCLYLYDADYSYIDLIRGMGRKMDGTYIDINTQIPIPEGVAYIRAGYRLQATAGDIFYLDGYSCIKMDVNRILSNVIVLASLDANAGTADTDTDKKDCQMYNTYEADLLAVLAGGTNPTLDVTVYEVNHSYDKKLVGTFAQVTATGQERITLEHCTGKELYIEYTIGGTNTPHFYFDVILLLKR